MLYSTISKKRGASRLFLPLGIEMVEPEVMGNPQKRTSAIRSAVAARENQRHLLETSENPTIKSTKWARYSGSPREKTAKLTIHLTDVVILCVLVMVLEKCYVRNVHKVPCFSDDNNKAI